ncbi:MAG: DUF4136 domain-containing protein [Steroidobacteraceae bacterium]
MMKQLARTGIVVATIFGGLVACTTLRVTSDVNNAVVGSVHCHTFAWAGTFKGNSALRSGNGIANPVNESRLRNAIAANLAAAGVQPVTTHGGADCLVGYGIGAHTVVEGAYPAGWGWGGWGGWGYGYGWGWGPGYYGGYWGWDEPYVYHEGVIAVDLYDGRSKQPIWHASVNQSLYGATGADADNKINKAVAALFTKYPRP